MLRIEHLPAEQTVAVLPRGNSLVIAQDPVETVFANGLDGVTPCIQYAEAAANSGLFVVGYVAYEAAPAFDMSLDTHPSLSGLSLAAFAVFRGIRPFLPEEYTAGSWSVTPWTSQVTREKYDSSLSRIKEFIAAGDTYQVNFTFPLDAAFEGDPLGWYLRLRKNQKTDFGGYLRIGHHAVVSLSPELFFSMDGDRLETRPMKGTRPRAPQNSGDRMLADDLRTSEKDRAENVMIVDLLRNDMGRVSETGSVEVTSLFDVCRYETVWQMTSTIRSRCHAPLHEIFAGLFPCGSVTGAPKVRTMQIVRELEHQPRGIYCGAFGWIGPGRKAQFSVPIRTALVDLETGSARCSVGSGITWDSAPVSEYEECICKAAFLDHPAPDFELLESILWTGKDYWLLEEHMERVGDAAEYFGYAINADDIRNELESIARTLPDTPQKIRLLVGGDGTFRVTIEPVPASEPVILGIAADPINSNDPFLYHKTTHRRVYEQVVAGQPDCDDVILWNERGELTETTRANLLLKIDEKWLTPPVECGLLAGTLRRHLLEQGEIQEAVLRKKDLIRAEALEIVNSVRGRVPATVKNGADAPETA